MWSPATPRCGARGWASSTACNGGGVSVLCVSVHDCYHLHETSRGFTFNRPVTARTASSRIQAPPAVQTSSPIADRTDTANHALPYARPRLQPRPRFGGHVQRQEHRLRQLVRRPPSQAALPTRWPPVRATREGCAARVRVSLPARVGVRPNLRRRVGRRLRRRPGPRATARLGPTPAPPLPGARPHTPTLTYQGTWRRVL